MRTLRALVAGLLCVTLGLAGCGNDDESEALEAALRACDTSNVPGPPQTASGRRNPELWAPIAEAWQDLADEAGRAAILDPTWEPLFEHTNEIVGFVYSVGGHAASSPGPNRNSSSGGWRFSPPSSSDPPDPFDSEEWRSIATGITQECRRAALMAEDA